MAHSAVARKSQVGDGEGSIDRGNSMEALQKSMEALWKSIEPKDILQPCPSVWSAAAAAHPYEIAIKPVFY